MSSTFGGLNTAASGLYAAQRALDVTGQNVSNVNTDGYSRQRVDLQSIGASAVPAIWSTGDGIGSGVDSDDVLRIRDAFLEGRAQTEHGKNSQLTTEDDAFTQIQQAFNEPTSGSGISSQLTNMWNAWQSLANSPTGSGADAAGTALLTTTQTLVTGLNTARATLSTQWSQTHSNLVSTVDTTNSVTANIAKLNQAIQRATQSGQPANELQDQRDTLVMNLADSMGAVGQPAADGMVNVSIGGISLVAGTTSSQLALAGATDLGTPTGNGPDSYTVTDPPRITTVVGGASVSVGGTAGGYLNALTNLVPTYAGQLDSFAAGLAGQVNGVLQSAGSYDGNTPPATGSAVKAMFGSSDPDPTAPITAANITLAISDPKDIAASRVAPQGSTPSVDGSNADAVAKLGTSSNSPDATYRAMIVKLGVQASSTSANLQIQNTVTSTVDNDRESVSGVDIDEEMTNMLSFQHSYSAAARLISVIDQNLDTLMGMVGN